VYRITGTITKTRNQNIIGAGSRACILQCHLVAGPCLVIADVTGGENNYNFSSLQDLTLQGPGATNNSVGVYLGGDPSGQLSAKNAHADSASLINVRVTGFNRGIVWGNNAWGNKLVRSLVFGNATGLYVPSGLTNSGENIGLTDTTIFNNNDFGIDDHDAFESMINGTSLDYNGTAIEFFGSTIHIVNSHIEQNGGPAILQPYGSGALSIRDSQILVQTTSGSDNYILSLWPQSLQLAIDNVSVWSNHPIKSFMHVSGAINGTISGLYGNGNKMIHMLSDPPNALIIKPTTSSAF
jgi:hypothetical protein